MVEAKHVLENYQHLQNTKKIRENHDKEQKNMFGIPSNAKYSLKMPFIDAKSKASDVFWKKPRKLKYFF